MRLKLLDNLRQRVLEEVDYAVEVELAAENVEEDILTVALIELTDRVDKLVVHREALAGVARALDHRSHLVLEIADLVLQLGILALQLIPLRLHGLILLRDDLILGLQILNFFHHLFCRQLRHDFY